MFYKVPNALLPYLVCSAIWDPSRSCLGWSWCGPGVPSSTGTTLARARLARPLSPGSLRFPPGCQALGATPLGWQVPLTLVGDHCGPRPQLCHQVHASHTAGSTCQTSPSCHHLASRDGKDVELTGLLWVPLRELGSWLTGCRSRRPGGGGWEGTPPRWVCFCLSIRLRVLTLQGHRCTSTLLWTFSLSFPKSGWQCLQPKNKPPLPLGALRFILFKLHRLFSFLGVWSTENWNLLSSLPVFVSVMESPLQHRLPLLWQNKMRLPPCWGTWSLQRKTSPAFFHRCDPPF